MIKKIILFILLTFCYCQLAMGEVIELSNTNSLQCRQQLVTGMNQFPVVFVYMKGCSWADKVRPIYEQVTKETPYRNFYAFNFSSLKNKENNALYMRTAMECLGFAPFRSPFLTIYHVLFTSSPAKYSGYVYGVYKLGLNGDANKEDILRFIQLSNHVNATYALE